MSTDIHSKDLAHKLATKESLMEARKWSDCFIILTNFYQILVSPNPLIAYRHAFQRLIASSEYIYKIMNRADDVKDLLG